VRHEEERRKEEGGGRRRRRKEEEKEERRKQGEKEGTKEKRKEQGRRRRGEEEKRRRGRNEGGRRRRRKEGGRGDAGAGGRRKGGGGGGRTSWRTATLPPRSTIFSELWKMMVPRKFNFNSRVKTVTNYSFFDICKLGSPKIRFCVFSMASSQEEDAQGDSQPKENSPAPDPYYLSSCCCEKHLRIVVGSQEAS